MRFREDGPDIPASLIQARDQGQVVFFCGAGVSAPAGLPSFEGLADKLIRRMRPDRAKRARSDKEPLDRVFNELVKEFGGAEVDRRIAGALRTPKNADLRFHKAVIDLARGADGLPKLVTTNFDHLFERAAPRIRSYVPPALPDLALQQPIDGVVYLHGRLGSVRGTRAGYVITSADFGRAYLAEGWAARFVRELGERYTIVLLGYSANDPPMRYLLEGLHSREDPVRRAPIYAIAPEGDSAADEAWLDKGVTTIPYSPRDDAHSGLWESLFDWAEAARDPSGWRARIVGLAKNNPAQLKPYERGQVAHLVSTAEGADAFASATPPPPAEWLCVFDSNVRYSEPRVMRLTDDEREKVDPLRVFGLDGDPPRPEKEKNVQPPPPGDDLLGWRVGDTSTIERQRLSGFLVEYTNHVAGRLYHLARWIASVMEQPAAIWWAGVNVMPHPVLVREISNRMDKPGTRPDVRAFWRCYLEACRSHAADREGFRLYNLADRVLADGWSRSVLLELERALAPTFELKRSWAAGPVPPPGDFETLRLTDLVHVSAVPPRWPEDRLDPPSEWLAEVVAAARQSLRTLALMLLDSTDLYLRLPSLHPTGAEGDIGADGRKAQFFLKFAELFRRLAQDDARAARREVAAWDPDDGTFFAQLFLYAAWLPGLLAAKDFAAGVHAMSEATFWGDGSTRELLLALAARWAELASAEKKRIERRIIAGPPAYDGESRAAHRRRKGVKAATWLEWLKRQGVQLSPAADARLPQLKAADKRWNDRWSESAADRDGPTGGIVRRVTEPQGLEGAPIAELLSLASALTRDEWRELRDYRPFDGVARAAPFRALSALRLSARKGDVPVRFWRSLVDNWPEKCSARLSLLFAHTLSRLPNDAFHELRYGVSRWSQTNLPIIASFDLSAAVGAFDAILKRYETSDAKTLESAVGHVTVRGMPQTQSQVSFMKAINSPAGQLTEAALKMLGTREQPEVMPTWADGLLIRLLQLPGNGGGHAASFIGHQLEWLRHWFPGWADPLLGQFALDQPLSEAFWHGLLAGNLISDALGRQLKRPLLALLLQKAPWALDQDERRALVNQMVNLTLARGGRSVVGFSEARAVLSDASDEDRLNALFMLANSIGTEGMWKRLIRPFLLRAWPRQLRYQTAETGRQFAEMAVRSEEKFPQVVATILPFLRPAQNLDLIAYRLTKGAKGNVVFATKYPSESLSLLDALVGDDPGHVPWNFAVVLEEIGDAAPALRQSDRWRRLRALA